MLFAKAFLLFSSVVSATLMVERSTIEERTPATILNDIKGIDTDIKNLTTQINAWDGTLGHVIPIIQAEQALEKQINLTTADLQKEAVFSCADSAVLLNYLSKTVEPDLKALVAALINAKPKFVKDGFQTVIKNYINNLRKEIAAFFAALCAKVCAADQAQCKALAAQFDKDILAAVNAYAS